MTSVWNIDGSAIDGMDLHDGTAIEGIDPHDRPAKRPGKFFSGALFVALLLLVGANAGTLVYTAKNAAEIRENREKLAALKGSLENLNGQLARQAQKIESRTRIADFDLLRARVDTLSMQISAVEEKSRTEIFSAPASNRLVLSAPGKEVSTFLQKQLGGQPEELSQASPPPPAVDVPDGVSGELPRYERSISPEGKLILKKVR